MRANETAHRCAIDLASTHTRHWSGFAATERGRPELNERALHRFLAESAWYPTALLPRDELSWFHRPAQRTRNPERSRYHRVARVPLR